MRAARIGATLTMVFLLTAGVSLLLFVCTHFRNWWSLFIILACLVAVVTPNICFGFDSRDISLLDVAMEEESFRSCQELGWSIGVVMWLFSYVIPVLAWYNSGLRWDAVLLLYTCITGFAWAFLIWRKVFV